MMTRNNKLIAVSQLLEMISPDGKIFEQSLEAFEQEYFESTTYDLSLLWALYQVGEEKSIFAAQEDDVMELIRQLKSVASYWEADIFLGDLDGEDDSWLYELEPQAILTCAASELHNYGLILWQWQGEENDIYCGFLSREEDQHLIERCGKQLMENFAKIKAM